MSGREFTEFEKEIVDNVARHGCFIMSVFDPDGAEPEFSYSIGLLETAGQPEVIVFSLPKNLRASMINEIGRQMRDEGLCLSDGAQISGLLEGHHCIVREITTADAIGKHFGSAVWYSRLHNVELKRVFQIVWPGARQHLFPWETGCDTNVIADQPALYIEGAVW